MVADKGSIPACAGETQFHINLQSSAEVYPRVCGGNHFVILSSAGNYGLSPRVRGNCW